MESFPVSGQLAIRPSVRIGAIESERVSIMAVNIDLRSPVGARGEVSLGRGIVIDVWHNDTCVPELLLNDSPIVLVGEFDVVGGTGVLVLGLEENDGAAVGDLGLGDNLSDRAGVAKKVMLGGPRTK